MKQQFLNPRLIPHDIYTGQQHVWPEDNTYPSQTQQGAYAQQQMLSSSTSLYSTPHPFQTPSSTQRRKRRIVPLLIVLTVIMLVVISSLYIFKTPAFSSTTSSQTTTSFANRVGQGSELSPQLTALKQSAQARISQFATDVDTIKHSGGDVTAYQQAVQRDNAQLAAVASSKDAVVLLIQVASDLSALQGDLAGNSASTLLSNFQQEAQQWGDAHKYHDPYDQQDYSLDSSYLNIDGHNGIRYGEGAYMQNEVNSGNAQAAQDIKDDYFLLSMLEANYADPTPYNQPHQTDQSLLNYFGFQHTRVLVVSLTEQALRIYNNGQLEQAFQVTTGRVYRPTPVGHFQLTQHFYNLTMQSYDSPSSPDYYTPVVVKNAIQFWNNGYLIHSSQWRQDYGPFTQFPHHDSGGSPDASTGSHGCINVAPTILSNLDPTITDQTALVIF